MSKILGIDTSTVAASTAILDDDTLLSEEYSAHKLKHSNKLLPMVKHTLEDSKVNMTDIDYFAVGNGPGSFTGLRIAAATIKSFAHTMNKKIISVSSLMASAENVKRESKYICAIFNAQRHDVYYNIYESKDGILNPVHKQDSIICIDSLILELKEYEHILMVGDSVDKYKDILLKSLDEKVKFADEEHLLPRASSIVRLAKLSLEKEENIYSYDNFLPNYIRVSAAEEQLKNKMREK